MPFHPITRADSQLPIAHLNNLCSLVQLGKCFVLNHQASSSDRSNSLIHAIILSSSLINKIIGSLDTDQHQQEGLTGNGQQSASVRDELLSQGFEATVSLAQGVLGALSLIAKEVAMSEGFNAKEACHVLTALKHAMTKILPSDTPCQISSRLLPAVFWIAHGGLKAYDDWSQQLIGLNWQAQLQLYPDHTYQKPFGSLFGEIELHTALESIISSLIPSPDHPPPFCDKNPHMLNFMLQSEALYNQICQADLYPKWITCLMARLQSHMSLSVQLLRELNLPKCCGPQCGKIHKLCFGGGSRNQFQAPEGERLMTSHIIITLNALKSSISCLNNMSSLVSAFVLEFQQSMDSHALIPRAIEGSLLPSDCGYLTMPTLITTMSQALSEVLSPDGLLGLICSTSSIFTVHFPTMCIDHLVKEGESMVRLLAEAQDTQKTLRALLLVLIQRLVALGVLLGAALHNGPDDLQASEEENSSKVESYMDDVARLAEQAAVSVACFASISVSMAAAEYSSDTSAPQELSYAACFDALMAAADNSVTLISELNDFILRAATCRTH